MRCLRAVPWRALAVGLAATVFGLAVAGFVLDRAFPPPIDRAGAVSAVVTDRGGLPLRAFPVEEGRWRLAADLDRVDPAFVAALLAVEDERFHQHPGVDPLAVIRAAGSAIANRRITSGASTITMQTARLLEPRPRTLASKLIEAFRAVQIEARLTKRDILELYLTLAPYGGNLQGVRAASWAWFDSEPDVLTPEEIALLIALPQAPEGRRPDLRPEAAVAARARVLDRMARLGFVSAARARECAKAPAPDRHPFPSEAWHASEAVRARTADAPEARSTIDIALQREVARLIRALAEEAWSNTTGGRPSRGHANAIGLVP